jgi:hypothetical protein
MTKRLLLSMSVILSTAIAAPLFAQGVVQEPDAYAFYHSNGNLGIESTPSRRREDVVVSRGTANNMELPSSFHPSMPGKETTTKPWSAPVGHRQPSAVDVIESTSDSQPILGEENAKIDRIVRGICRGC